MRGGWMDRRGNEGSREEKNAGLWVYAAGGIYRLAGGIQGSGRIFDFRAFHSPHNQPIIHVALPLPRPFQVIIGGHSWKYIALSATVYTLHSLMIGLKIDPPPSRADRVIGNGRVARNECLESVLESWKDVFYPTVPSPSCIPRFPVFSRSFFFFFSNNLNLEAKHS